MIFRVLTMIEVGRIGWPLVIHLPELTRHDSSVRGNASLGLGASAPKVAHGFAASIASRDPLLRNVPIRGGTPTGRGWPPCFSYGWKRTLDKLRSIW